MTHHLVALLAAGLALSPLAAAAAPALANESGPGPAELVLPAPTGAYPVGTFTTVITDPSRREVFTADPTDIRRFPIQVWYPASAAPCAGVPYMDADIGKAYTRSLHLAPGFETHVRARACARAPFAPGRYPVVLFSHGLGETRFSYVSILEDIASHGYIVIAMDHTYGARTTVLPGIGTRAMDNYRWHEGDDDASLLQIAISENFREWTADARSLLDVLARAKPPATLAPVLKHADVTTIAYVGHSYGGLSAVYAAELDSRIRAVVNLDGGVFGLPTPVTLDVPTLVLADAMGDDKAKSYTPGATVTVVTVAGMQHESFSDLLLLLGVYAPPPSQPPKLAAPLSAEAGIALTRRAIGVFLDCRLKAKGCDTLSAFYASLRAPAPPAH